ncbi:tetratricopeptide repeat protein [Marinomonas sp. 15G1-11]|uniref:Tetratricopeptide repeat protein n=1 Tax=Marinomonas phaeophyticola TaxID=3004091 RepID=A0ABT4JWQ7_9GAMM|nr:tetratricopeptide repeat protein [Marinomonas sp. 15G1-11]MCZ2722813.1 tetratricopeptide repeat protein [Marinomonas sp. 15G1-11]
MTQDQLAQSKVDNGQWDEASSLFENKKWQAASNYAVERYSEAADVLKSQASSASDFYNLGNSLALSGNLEDAIQAFKKSLELDPNSKAAQENLAYLQQKQKEQKQDQDQDQDQQQNQKPNNDPQQSKEKNNTENQQKKSQNKDGTSDEEKEDNKTSDEQNNTPDDEKNAINNTESEKNDITDEEKIALDQWLRQIQDDPGGLLKRKLWYLHQEKRAENRFKQEDGLPIW